MAGLTTPRYGAAVGRRKTKPTPPWVLKIIGQNVKRLRTAKGFTQESLMEASGTEAVRMIEAGQRGSLPTLFAIAKALRLNFDELLAGITAAEIVKRTEPTSTTSRRRRRGAIFRETQQRDHSPSQKESGGTGVGHGAKTSLA